MNIKFSILITVAFSINAFAATEKPICTRLREATRSGSASTKLNQFLSTKWEYEMHEYPQEATSVGYPGQNDRLADLSLATIARHKKEDVCELLILKTIARKSLQAEERVSFDLMQRQLEDSIEGAKFPSEYLALDQWNGLQAEFPDLLTTMPSANKQDYLNMIARLKAVDKAEAQEETLLREGVKIQVTATKLVLNRVPPQLDQILNPKIEESPLYEPFKNMNVNLSEGEKLDLRKQAKEAIETHAYPAFERLKKFLITEYIPHSREAIAWNKLPDGEAWYAYAVRMQTTTKLTPKELHELGLREVDRITQAMEELKSQVKFKGDLSEFNKMLMTSDNFEYKTADALLIGFRDIAKRIDVELPRLFKTLPRLTYGVKPVPDYKAADSPAAYYQPGSLEGARAGVFTANTSDISHRPTWMMEALTLHEAVPGHHLQISLQQELQGLPQFRRQGWSYTAFVEGWGLYSESLGAELGLYTDPYSHYGQLSLEMWRSIRLVVDTGIHSMGWTRDQAIEYFNQHMPKSEKEIAVEVDRYIAWPGQALAYKVGQLKFLELRARTQKALGAAFDVREFHEAMLSHGALPLDVLEKNFNEWLAAQVANLNRKHK